MLPQFLKAVGRQIGRVVIDNNAMLTAKLCAPKSLALSEGIRSLCNYCLRKAAISQQAIHSWGAILEGASRMISAETVGMAQSAGSALLNFAGTGMGRQFAQLIVNSIK